MAAWQISDKLQTVELELAVPEDCRKHTRVLIAEHAAAYFEDGSGVDADTTADSAADDG